MYCFQGHILFAYLPMLRNILECENIFSLYITKPSAYGAMQCTVMLKLRVVGEQYAYCGSRRSKNERWKKLCGLFIWQAFWQAYIDPHCAYHVPSKQIHWKYIRAKNSKFHIFQNPLESLNASCSSKSSPSVP